VVQGHRQYAKQEVISQCKIYVVVRPIKVAEATQCIKSVISNDFGGVFNVISASCTSDTPQPPTHDQFTLAKFLFH